MEDVKNEEMAVVKLGGKSLDLLVPGDSPLTSPPSVSQFKWERRTYRLRRPVSYHVSYDGGWIYECERYGLHAFSADKDEAFAQFNEEFAFLYEGLVEEADENLTQDAIDLKSRIIEDVASAS